MSLPNTIGLVVNPIAGLGGAAGLKGSDGAQIQELARARGGVAQGTERAAAALRALPDGTAVHTSAGAMGADAAGLVGGLVVEVVHHAGPGATTAADTRDAVAALVASGVGLVLFAGGDGTARDVAASLAGTEVAGLGVPCGVKMYSPCFAVSPAVAGRMAARWVAGQTPTESRPVLDVPEDLARQGLVQPEVFGTMLVPQAGGRTQSGKLPAAATAGDQQRGIAQAVVDMLDPAVSYLLGPGSTVDAVAAALGIPRTPIGFDVVRGGELVTADASETDLLRVVRDHPARAVITVIGGQGFLLGRGNQQLSAAVLRELAPDPLIVIATPDKLRGLAGPLLIDTGDVELDRELAGYRRVITGVQDTAIVRAIAAVDDGTTT